MSLIKNERLSRPDFVEISMEDALKLEDYVHAAHCMLYAPWDQTIIGTYKTRAAILMQMRFDGNIGFPGGAVKKGEDILMGLNRELEEEINLDTRKFRISSQNHFVSHYTEKQKLVTHFFVLGVKYEDFVEIETACRQAKEHGHETFGVTRVPLYTMRNGYGGFPSFLNNSFSGNASEQLLRAVEYTGLMTSEEVDATVKSFYGLQKRT